MSAKGAANRNHTGLTLYGEFKTFFTILFLHIEKQIALYKYFLTYLFALMRSTFVSKFTWMKYFRWWVVCHANSVPQSNVSANVLKASSEEVQKIRNTLRFALGGLFDYVPLPFDYNSLLLVDKYILHLLYNFHNDVSI